MPIVKLFYSTEQSNSITVKYGTTVGYLLSIHFPSIKTIYNKYGEIIPLIVPIRGNLELYSK